MKSATSISYIEIRTVELAAVFNNWMFVKRGDQFSLKYDAYCIIMVKIGKEKYVNSAKN